MAYDLQGALPRDRVNSLRAVLPFRHFLPFYLRWPFAECARNRAK